MISHNILSTKYNWQIIFFALVFLVVWKHISSACVYGTNDTSNSSENHNESSDDNNVTSIIDKSFEELSIPCSNVDVYDVVPEHWPCEWNNGIIPYVLDFYASSPRRLMTLVHRGHEYLEARSCFHFVEQDPVKAARTPNYTYLYYTFSGVLEKCCSRIWVKTKGRRVILISPTCTLPPQVAHTTIHAFGLTHSQTETLNQEEVGKLLFMPSQFFPEDCEDFPNKYARFMGSDPGIPLFT